MSKKITIFHLYPDTMNLYGDLGNIIAITKRCQWREIDTEIINVNIGDKVDFSKADFIFMGGGQDSGQNTVANDLMEKGPAIKTAIDEGVVALTICGGFQLFGQYFQTISGNKIPGIGVFDAYTIAKEKRITGNVIVDIGHTISELRTYLKLPQLENSGNTLVGFENHSGFTYINNNTPLGYVRIGGGNSGDRGYEGCVYKNAFGSYLHGSLLPKNPRFTDNLIMLALLHRYGTVEQLKILDDSIEMAAHEAAIKRAETAQTVSI